MLRTRTLATIIGIGFGAALATATPVGAETSCTGLLCVPAPSEQPAEPQPQPQPQPQPAPQPAPGGSPDGSAQASASPAPGTVDHAAAARLLELVNEERRRAGVAPLGRRGDLDQDAVDHSRSMARSGTIYHNDAWFSAANRQRLGARRMGENVAMNGSVEDAHRRLMASEGHRRNILDGGFRLVGLGVVRGQSSWFITQSFIEPVAAPTARATDPPSTSGAPTVRATSVSRPAATPSPVKVRPAAGTAARPAVAAPATTTSTSTTASTTTTAGTPTTDTTATPRTVKATALPDLSLTGEGDGERTWAMVAALAISAALLRLRRMTAARRLPDTGR